MILKVIPPHRLAMGRWRHEVTTEGPVLYGNPAPPSAVPAATSPLQVIGEE